jgi:hypothetical protein
MEKYSTNQAKKLARLYYQDKIWQLAAAGKSVREITELINRQYIPRSKFKGVTLSKSTIHTIIKKGNRHGTF